MVDIIKFCKFQRYALNFYTLENKNVCNECECHRLLKFVNLFIVIKKKKSVIEKYALIAEKEKRAYNIVYN